MAEFSFFEDNHPELRDSLEKGEIAAAQIDLVDLIDEYLDDRELGLKHFDFEIPADQGKAIHTEMLNGHFKNVILQPGSLVFPGKDLYWATIRPIAVSKDPSAAYIRTSVKKDGDMPGDAWRKSIGLLFTYDDEDVTKRHSHQDVGVVLNHEGDFWVYRQRFGALGDQVIFQNSIKRQGNLADLKYMHGLISELDRDERN